MEDFMTSVETQDKRDLKTEKKLWRQLGKLKTKRKFTTDNTKQFRIVQSVNAGHIRGGHAFH
jgi:hypothetical protein